jgi:adenylate cyclase
VKLLRDGRRVHAEKAAGTVPGLPLVLRTFGGITALVAAANVAGGVVVGLLLVALNADATSHQRTVVLGVGAGYGVVALAVGAVVGFAVQARTLRWLVRGRIPTRDEARRALRNPMDLAVLTGRRLASSSSSAFWSRPSS